MSDKITPRAKELAVLVWTPEGTCHQVALNHDQTQRLAAWLRHEFEGCVRVCEERLPLKLVSKVKPTKEKA